MLTINILTSCLCYLMPPQVTSEAYSSPSIVLAANQHDGSRIIFDDFREAYYWLRQNTPEDAKVMSWWDYGYQITAMANRTILVDNNTWNNTHISRVGQVSSGECVCGMTFWALTLWEDTVYTEGREGELASCPPRPCRPPRTTLMRS